MGLSDYSFGDKVLGRGAFGVVYYGRNKKNQEVAIKKIAKKNLDRNIIREIEILQEIQELRKDNLVILIDYEEMPDCVYLVMEYCNHGNLAEYLLDKHTLDEKTIHHFFAQIVKALEELNRKAIVHRDLKPQNILLCNPRHPLDSVPTDLVVKLADFGLSRYLAEGIMASTRCGTPMYMAPEVIMSYQYGAKTSLWSMAVAFYKKLTGKSCQYGNKSDLWSLGVMMYQCLNGTVPFMPEAKSFIELKIYYETHKALKPKIPDSTSALLSDLLNGLLKRNPSDRIEYIQLFNHQFFCKTEDFFDGSPITLVFGCGEPNESGIYQAKLEGYKEREKGSVPFTIPIASFPPPNYIKGSEKIKIDFLDGQVMKCIKRIYPILNVNSMIIRRFDRQIFNSKEQFSQVHRLLEMLVKKTNSLLDENLFDLKFNPNVHGLIENVQMIRGMGKVGREIHVLFQWLIISRLDQKPKLLEFHQAESWYKESLIELIKEQFIDSTQSANFLISFNCESADYRDFTMENELTEEVLALYTNVIIVDRRRNVRQFLVRHAKGEEHLRANWENLSEIDCHADVYIHIHGIGEF